MHILKYLIKWMRRVIVIIMQILFKQLIFTNNWDTLGTFLCLTDRSVFEMQTAYAVFKMICYYNRIGYKTERYLVYQLQSPPHGFKSTEPN